MWRSEILAAALLRDNGSESPLRDRQSELRVLWLGLRGVVLFSATLLLHVMLPGVTRWPLVAAGAVGCAMSEAIGVYARQSRDHRQLERRVLFAAFAVACSSFCVMRAYGGDFVDRLGGDEFVVLMPHAGTEGAQALAARIHDATG